MAANRDKTQSLARPAHFFKPGQSGNPNGRPKSFGALVRRSTKDGKELVELALKIVRDEIALVRVNQGMVPYEMKPTIRDMIDAMEWLANRGWGKAYQHVGVENPDGGPCIVQILTLSEEERRAIHESQTGAVDGGGGT